MKYLVLILTVVSTVSCAPLTVGAIGVVTGVALTTNIPAVEKAGDEYLSDKEGK